MNSFSVLPSTIIDAYATLLVDYCCNIQKNDRVLLRSTYLAEPLLLACQKHILLRGAHCEWDIAIHGERQQWYNYATDNVLQTVSPIDDYISRTITKLITIRAPFELFELAAVPDDRIAMAQASRKSIKSLTMKRGQSGDLHWVICNYPTVALAQAAAMSLNEYAHFVAQACFLTDADPAQQWRELSRRQAAYVDRFNRGKTIRFEAPHVAISCGIAGRRWINSDGKRNMPSGEIFTSPIENSVNGTITFTHPSLLFGEVIQNLTLTMQDGVVTQWQSDTGQALLERLFAIDGANRLGEIAVGTNHAIQRATLNTLFDEKIGGTIHMAVGASYPETGGTNQSGIHHDFITQFNTKSAIYLDDDLVYKDGQFCINTEDSNV